MRLWHPIKVIEIGLGLGVAAFLGWILLAFPFLLPLLELDLEPGALSTRLLAALAQDLSLLVSMLLMGLLAGALIVSGRWAIAGITAGVALAFRLAVPFASGEPDAPWQDWVQAGVRLAAVGAGILLFAWGFGLSRRLLERRARRAG